MRSLFQVIFIAGPLLTAWILQTEGQGVQAVVFIISISYPDIFFTL